MVLEKSDIFDNIVIDGRERVTCASAAHQTLTDRIPASASAASRLTSSQPGPEGITS